MKEREQQFNLLADRVRMLFKSHHTITFSHEYNHIEPVIIIQSSCLYNSSLRELDKMLDDYANRERIYLTYMIRTNVDIDSKYLELIIQ